MYAGGFPYDLTEGDLLAVFSQARRCLCRLAQKPYSRGLRLRLLSAQYGEVVDVNVVRDRDTGKSKGFAFLAYEDQRSTVLAVDNLSGSRVAGRTLRVEHVDDYKLRRKEVEKEGGVVGAATGAVDDAARMPPPPPPPPRVSVPAGAVLEQAGERGEEPFAWGGGPPQSSRGGSGGGSNADADADADARALAIIKARRAAVMAAAAAAAGGAGVAPPPGLLPGLQAAPRAEASDRAAAKLAKKDAKRARKEARHAKRDARRRTDGGEGRRGRSTSSSSSSGRRSRSRSRDRRGGGERR